MAAHTKSTSVLHFLFLLMCNSIALPHSLQELGVRVKRQDGYVYGKPSISFNLPTRPPSTVATQAPTVDRPQEQQMYYAYPAPAGGDTVNIGRSTVGSSSTTAATATASSGGGGYNYGSQGTTTSITSASGSGANSGYNYNTPTSTAGTTPVVVTQTIPSTNAPKYLPPALGGGVSVNIPTGGATTVPSVSVSTTKGGVSVPNTDYLPPHPNQEQSPGPSPSPSPPPSPSPSPNLPQSPGYLPPSGSSITSVPTPAATYLPPVL